MSPVLRNAVLTDLPALREVFRRSSLSNESDRPLLSAHPELLELSETAVREERTRVALVGDRIVGFASTIVGEDAVEVEDLFVDPDWMRQGIGRALVEDVLTTARTAGLSRVEVDANRHALGFYTQVGFTSLGEVPVAYGTAIRMGLNTRP
jgi:GNAT superfamily N-acetyltransferase